VLSFIPAQGQHGTTTPIANVVLTVSLRPRLKRSVPFWLSVFVSRLHTPQPSACDLRSVPSFYEPFAGRHQAAAVPIVELAQNSD
jgi:hypothetical protein